MNILTISLNPSGGHGHLEGAQEEMQDLFQILQKANVA
jgi:hypothetical protein